MQNQPYRVPKQLRNLLKLRGFLSFLPCVAAYGYIGLMYSAFLPIFELDLPQSTITLIFLVSIIPATALALILHFLFQVMLRNLYYDCCARTAHITMGRSWHAKSITERTRLIEQKLGSDYLYTQDPKDVRFSGILTLVNMAAFGANFHIVSPCLRILIIIALITIFMTCILYNLIGCIVTRRNA